MKKLTASVLVMVMFAGSVQAGGMNEPIVEEEVVVAAQTSSSSGGLVVLLLLGLAAVAVASGTKGTTDCITLC